jgi:hypothetical protein
MIMLAPACLAYRWLFALGAILKQKTKNKK